MSLTSCSLKRDYKQSENTSKFSKNKYLVPKQFIIKEGSVIKLEDRELILQEDVEAVSFEYYRRMLLLEYTK